MVIKEISQIALTSNIESITGFVGEVNFLTGIVEKSLNKFDKLKTLAVSFAGNPPSELALHCRETIQTMDLDFYGVPNGIDWSFMDRLNEFHHLTSFTLAADVLNFRNLDKILDGCPHLREFTLIEKGWSFQDDVDLDPQDIKRHSNMKALRLIMGFAFDDMMGYLLCKFINAEEIDLSLTNDYYFDGIFPGSEQERWEYLEIKKAAVEYILFSVNKRTDCIVNVEEIDEFYNLRFKIVQK